MRYYDIGSTSTAQTAALDFLELQPADDIANKICGCEITQSTEIGDAMEEMLLLAIRRGNTTSGSGGVTTTANLVDANDAAYAGTAPETQNTTKATTSGGTTRGPWSFNVRVGFVYMWPLETAPRADQGDSRICVELVAAPADSVTWQPAFSIMEM